MDFSIKDHLVFSCLHGSRAYGINTPESDYDWKGIVVSPKKYYMGIGYTFEQRVGSTPPDLISDIGDHKDTVFYDIRKFAQLALLANPNILEILYADFRGPGNQAINSLIQNRDLFVSTKCRHSFAGYAHAQLKRINTHRKWLLDPPKAPPVRSEFGLPADDSVIGTEQLKAAISLVDKLIESWSINPEETIPISILNNVRETIIDLIGNILNLKEKKDIDENITIAACNALNFDSNFAEYVVNHKKYTAAKRQWNSYQTWLLERNESRSQLEKKFGYDTKHAAHLVRLMRMCTEILEGKGVIVKRPDAEEIKAIRNGAWTIEQITNFAEAEDKKADILYQTNPAKLPYSPSIHLISNIVQEVIEHMHALYEKNTYE